MNLILLEPGEIAPDGRVRLADARATHIIAVLRAAPGRDVRVGIVDGPVGTAAVLGGGEPGCPVELQCVFDEVVPSRPRVDLLLALPRPKVMRRLWAQLAAVGVGRIVLCNASRVERNYFDTHILDPAHVRPLLIEGLQQARDTRLPAVSIHRQFRVLVEDDLDRLTGDSVRMVTHPAAARSLHDAVRSSFATPPAPPPSGGLAPTKKRLLLAVGPEGGWSTFELRLLEAHGFQVVGMGPRILRADTAAVALLALAHDALGQTGA